MTRRVLLWIAAAVAACGAAGCKTLFPTAGAGPQRVLVRDLETGTPIAGAEVEYEFTSFGPRASISRNRRGQIEVQPRLPMPDIDQPISRPLPGDDLEKVWDQYNEPADRGPVFNTDGSWNTANFRERSIRRAVLTDGQGRALLPIIHAPIRFRECRLTVAQSGYQPRTVTVRAADLDRLADRGRTVEVYLAPLRQPD
jgi:hypothetical protein